MKSKRHLQKLVSLILGVPIVILGIILIPLPGPGLLISLLGLYILSREFEWAEKHFNKAKGETQKIIDRAKAKS